MNDFHGKNHYEVLSLAPSASPAEIEKAYRKARALYGEDSVAIYSLYSTEEREAMLRQVIEAYETLKDTEKKKQYDNDLTRTQQETISSDATHASVEDVKPVAPKSSVISLGTGRSKLRTSLVTMNGSDLMAMEQYRVMYTKLDHINTENAHKVFAISSAVKGEGKTITTLNLGYIMASDFKKKTIIVECDLRKPAISSTYLETVQQSGLVDVLQGEADIKDAISQLELDNLYVLPAIHTVGSSSGLLSLRNMTNLISTLKADFDFVLLDCPPILPLADVNILSKITDGLILVVRAGETPRDIVLKAVKTITNTSVVGIVLNGSEPTKDKYYQYSY